MQIKEFMTHHHRECDSIFATLEEAVAKDDFGAALAYFEEFKAQTLTHFKQEEEFLFVEFSKSSGMTGGPIEVMTYEHSQLKSLIEQMQRALESKNKNEFFGIAEGAMILLQQHNMKEEQMLYNMIQMHLNDRNDAIVQILQDMNPKG